MFQRQETVVRVEVPLVRADQYLEVLHSPFISDQNRQSAALQILVPLAQLAICPDCPLAGRRMLIFAPDLATAAAIVSSLESLIDLHGSLLQNDGKTPRQVQVTMANAQLTMKSEVVERLTRPTSEEDPSFEIFVATTMVRWLAWDRLTVPRFARELMSKVARTLYCTEPWALFR